MLKKPGCFCSCGQNTTNNSDSNAINGCVSLYLKYKQVYIHKVDLTNARAHTHIYFFFLMSVNITLINRKCVTVLVKNNQNISILCLTELLKYT